MHNKPSPRDQHLLDRSSAVWLIIQPQHPTISTTHFTSILLADYTDVVETGHCFASATYTLQMSFA
jgi:hypothetical protein